MTPNEYRNYFRGMLVFTGLIGLFASLEYSQPDHVFQWEKDLNTAIQQAPDWWNEQEKAVEGWIDANLIEDNCWPIPQGTELCDYWHKLYPPEGFKK